jgi:predicted GIY-YIG superfamily endonuclease
MSTRILTYEICQKVASTCNTRIELQKKDSSVYNKIFKNNWTELLNHMEYIIKPSNYWTYDKCKEIAQKYKTFKDFMANDYAAYLAMRKKKEWFDELTKHLKYKYKPNGYWTYDKCEEITKKYTNLTEFRKDCKFVRGIIKKNNWEEELYKHMTCYRKSHNYWTYDKCKEVALNYDNKKDFRNNESTAAMLISRNNWNELTQHMKKLSTIKERVIYAFEFQDKHVYVGLTCNPEKRYDEHLSEERSQVYKHIKKTNSNYLFKILTDKPIPMELAGQQETNILNEYINNGWIILNKAKTGSLGGMRPIWTYDKCKEEALKYNCPIKLRKNLKHGIQVMKQKGWFEELTSHIIDNRKLNYWNNFQNCKKEALKYQKISEFQKKCSGAFKGMMRNGWKKELTKHITCRANK